MRLGNYWKKSSTDQFFQLSTLVRKASTLSWLFFLFIFFPFMSYPICSSSLYHSRGTSPIVFWEGTWELKEWQLITAKQHTIQQLCTHSKHKNRSHLQKNHSLQLFHQIQKFHSHYDRCGLCCHPIHLHHSVQQSPEVVMHQQHQWLEQKKAWDLIIAGSSLYHDNQSLRTPNSKSQYYTKRNLPSSNNNFSCIFLGWDLWSSKTIVMRLVSTGI